MKKKKKTFLKAGVLSVLVIGLSVACIPTVVAHSTEQAAEVVLEEEAEPAVYEKTEVVYATLSAEGAMKGIYVVNQFEVSQSGEIVDFGPYSTVANLTDQGALDFANNEAAFDAAEGAFYYQGNVEVDGAKLPWDLHLSYTLDGEAISPEDLAGKSGKLAVHVATSRASGVDESFADSYMLQVTFTLNGDTTSDIVAEGATIASSGRNRTVAFTVLPGRDADCTLSAQVTDFEMSGVQVAALPYSMAMEMPDTSDLTGQMQELSDAISEMDAGIADLAAGSAAFGEGLDAVAERAPMIAQYSSLINTNLSKISAGISVDNLKLVAESLNRLATALDEYSVVIGGYWGAIAGLEGAYYPLAPAEKEALLDLGLAADSSSSSILESASDESAPNVQTIASLVNKLYAMYGAGERIVGSLGSETQAGQAMALMCGSAEDSGSLRYMAAQLRAIANGIYSGEEDAQTLATAAAGLAALSQQYADLDANIAVFASGVTELNSSYAALNEGTQKIAGGMTQLNSATINIPATMRAEIEAMMADYDFPEFDPISFVDSRNNANMAAVQFVLTTDAIEVVEPEVVEEAEEEDETIVDRFFALFE